MQVGPPQEIYHDPANVFVATFLGSPQINLIERDGRLIGFRPEHFLPAGVAENGGDGRIPMRLTVTLVENLGADRLVYGEVENASSERPITAKLPSMVDIAIAPGETHTFAVAPANLKYFDKATGLKTEPVAL
jgi:multiple sugar transport system ATP-binding protein